MSSPRYWKGATEGKKIQDMDISESFKAFNDQEHLAGENLSSDRQVYRISFITTILKAGVTLNKLDTFRALLEQNGTCLAGRRSLSDLISFVHHQAVQKISKEIEGKKVSVIFDGTIRMGEAMAILVRFVSDDWHIEQQLICVQLLAKSLCGEEIARVLISVLQVTQL